MKYLIVLLFLTLNCMARFADFVWEAPDPSNPPQSVSKYNVYEKIGATVIKVGETSNGTTLSFRLNSVSDTAHTYYVTAVYSLGQESGPSNEVTIPAVSPPPPTGSANPPKNARVFVSP